MRRGRWSGTIALGVLVLLSACAEASACKPEVSATISPVPRVPVYGTNPLGTNGKSVTVTLTPSPLPEGLKVTVEISTTGGTGGATFDDGTTSKEITQTTTLEIRGTINSSVKDNMKIAAKYEGNELASRTFTVSTWPYGLQNTLRSKNLGFGLEVNVTWKSESGNVGHLTNIVLREYLTYIHPGENPPFTVHGNYPAAEPPDGVPGEDGGGIDTHSYLEEGVNWTGQEDYMSICQEYQFKDLVLGTQWENGVLDTAVIGFDVKKDPDPAGTYIFTTSKTGPGTFSDSCPEKP